MKTTLKTRLFALAGSLLFATMMTAGLASFMSTTAEQASPAFADAGKKTAPAGSPTAVHAAAGKRTAL